MGVGTFHSDFGGRGGTFIVSGSEWLDDGAHQAYLEELIHEHAAAVVLQCASDVGWVAVPKGDTSSETLPQTGLFDSKYDAFVAWARHNDVYVLEDKTAFQQDADESYNESFFEAIEAAGDALGAQIEARKGLRAESCEFDREFTKILDGDGFQVGWRSWESDFIVGCAVVGLDDILDVVDDDCETCRIALENHGLLPFQIRELASRLSAAVFEYVRLELEAWRFESRQRTSGYTSAAFPVMDAESRETQKRVLEKEVAACVLALDSKSALNNLAAQAREHRIEIARVLCELREYSPYGVGIPAVMDNGRADVHLVVLSADEADNVVDEDSMAAARALVAAGGTLTVSMVTNSAHNPCGMISLTDATQSFYRADLFRHVPGSRFRFLVAADEYCLGTGNALPVAINTEGETPYRIERSWYGRINTGERMPSLCDALDAAVAGQGYPPGVAWGHFDVTQGCYWVRASDVTWLNMLRTISASFGFVLDADPLVEGFETDLHRMTQSDIRARIARCECLMRGALMDAQPDMFRVLAPPTVSAEQLRQLTHEAAVQAMPALQAEYDRRRGVAIVPTSDVAPQL